MKTFITEIHVTVAHMDDSGQPIRCESQEWMSPAFDDEESILYSISQAQLRDAAAFLCGFEDRPSGLSAQVERSKLQVKGNQ